MGEKIIAFKQKFIPNIIDKSKTLTCRLKKEGEFGDYNRWVDTQYDSKGNTIFDCVETSVDSPEGRTTKFEVGEVYQVVVDKEPVWYCPKCKEFETENNLEKNIMASWHIQHCKGVTPKKLKIKILSIREQKLLDITNADAIKDIGCGNIKYPRKVFFNDFKECYLKWKDITNETEWNPEVFPIEFEVVE